MFQYRDYQKNIITNSRSKLLKLRIIMLAMQVRTGKTLTSFGIAEQVGAKKVLFVTKKKVMLSRTIHDDYILLNPSFNLKIINYESMHKVETENVDLFILDESHCLGAFPKPSLRAKNLKKIIGRKLVILLTGTPTPEGWSQLYHQFYISDYSPFKEQSFYKWASNYVFIKKIYIAHGSLVNDYKHANIKLIRQSISRYIINYSQQDAGFKTKVNEEILYVKMKPITYSLIHRLEKNLIIQGKGGGVILGDTPVKLMQKVHQMYSGTVKLEDGSSVIIDNSKALYIKDKFRDKKIAIFYKFKEELVLLKQVYGSNLTSDINEFNVSNKNIALQILSGREGISLSNADCLVFFNIDFSATSYWQARDRLTTKEREVNSVYWIFSEGGLENKIYKVVQDKKTFTTIHYQITQHERINTPNQTYKTA